MVELDQFKFELNAYDEPLEELRAALDLDNTLPQVLPTDSEIASAQKLFDVK